MNIKEISVIELKRLFDEDADFQLIDVREAFETEIANLWGELIPLGEVAKNLKKFSPKPEKIIVYCRSGKRSAEAIQYIQSQTQQENLYNLKGGILEWANKIDNSLKKY